ncbi:Uncharacterised protein [Janthinobacterium lividum]|uniref:hypothetical protein n=1 Tax=Janthinobacterium lividum TaxID=29581 RepID=UPI000DFB6AB7|nr:hypothetical protein [Janthinobacterium lividum]STQ93501.1 Uncharacterised protein [Janthinobacterium lividum]
MKILDMQEDTVINGQVAFAKTSYSEAVKVLVPLIDKTEFQRKLQDKKFYNKLERDISDGCVMPPITVAILTDKKFESLKGVQDHIEKNISKSFVLDGIQRLNTLSRAAAEYEFTDEYQLYINFILCNSVEKLLYRMITLNNGQRPMTPRHQVEIMIANVFNFKDMGIDVVAEKDSTIATARKAFRKADIIQAYLAFMADSPIVDNKKIIEEKMDELLVGRIMDVEPKKYMSSFKDFVALLAKFQKNAEAFKWLKITNNLVGLAAGIKHSMKLVQKLTENEFAETVEIFDQAFSDFNPSKIKVGKYRRELVYEYFKSFAEYSDLDSDELLSVFSELTAND